jgi:hypothetical protein
LVFSKQKESDMRKTKFTTLAIIFTAFCSSIFATPAELFTNTIPNTSEPLSQKADLYSRKDFSQDPSGNSPLFLSGTLLVLTPQTGFVPKKGLAPGFRIGGGLNAQNWEAGISYTYFSISSSDPLVDPDLIAKNDPLRKIKTDSNFSLNDYESVVAIPCALKNGLMLHPLLGVEHASNERKMALRYNKTPLSDNKPFSKFRGTGPQIGIKLQKILLKGFSVTGALVQSVLKSQISWESDKYQRYTPITKVRLGAEWSIGDDREKFFHLAAGYEGQYWINEAIVVNGNHVRNHNLGLQGFNIQAKLDF